MDEEPYLWCQCPYCDVVDAQYEGRWVRNAHLEDCPLNGASWQGWATNVEGRYEFTGTLLEAYGKAMVRDIPQAAFTRHERLKGGNGS